MAALAIALQQRKRIGVPALQSLIDSAPKDDHAVGILRQLEQYPDPVAPELYDGLLESLCRRGGSFTASPAAQALFAEMLAATRVKSSTLAILFEHMASLDEMAALAADAVDMKLLDGAALAALMDSYLRLAAQVSPFAQRLQKYAVVDALAALAPAGLLPDSARLRALMLYYAGCAHVRPAARVYELLASHPAWDVATLEQLLQQWARRPGAGGVNDDATGADPDPDLADWYAPAFFGRLWDALERRTQQLGHGPPSAASHETMVRT